MGVSVEALISSIIALISVIVWLIRLEGRVNNLDSTLVDFKSRTDSSIQEAKVRHESLDSKIVQKLSDIEKSLARIQGQLSVKDDSE